MLRRAAVAVVIATLALPGAVICVARLVDVGAACAMPTSHDCGATGSITSDCCVADSSGPRHATLPDAKLPGAPLTLISGLASLAAVPVTPLVSVRLEAFGRARLKSSPTPTYLVLSTFLI